MIGNSLLSLPQQVLSSQTLVGHKGIIGWTEQKKE
jgi:hypothetical protein